MPYDPSDWDTADDTAKDTAQHFYADSSGAHVTDETGAELLLTSGGIDISDDGNLTTAFFHSDGAQVGANTDSHIVISQNNIGMYVNYFTQTPPYEFVMKHALTIWYNWQNDYIQINSPDNKLWLQSQAGNITVSAADGDASAAVRLRGGRMQVVDENGNPLWSGTAQEMADALTRGSGAAVGGVHVYSGTLTQDIGAGSHYEATVWNSSTFNSTFHCSNAGQAQVFFANGDAGAGGSNSTYGGGVWGSEFWSSGSWAGWHVRFQSAISGNRRIDYLVIVPDAYSTV